MSRRRTVIAVVLVIAICLAALSAQWSRLSTARDHQRHADARLQTTAQEIRELMLLRARQRLDDPTEPARDAVARVAATLDDAALAQTILQSATPESRVGRPAVTLVLGPVRPSELGAWLDIWRRDHAEWRIDRITLRADRQQDNAYQAELRIEAPLRRLEPARESSGNPQIPSTEPTQASALTDRPSGDPR